MLNQHNHQKRASSIQPVSSAAGVAWHCGDCHVWWGSQNSDKPSTQFLLHLPEAVAQALPWDEYRGWNLLVERAGTCPECNQPTGRVMYAVA